MKVRKKLLSTFMAVVLLVGTILTSMGTTWVVDAGDNTAEKKIILEKQVMTGTREGFPFCYVAPYCMSSLWEIIVSENYTNVISYTAPTDGQIRIDALNVAIANTDEAEREIEFAVTDTDGVILTNNGNVTTLTGCGSTATGMTVEAIEIKAGESLDFVFHGNSGSVNSINCTAAVFFSADGTDWSLVSREGGKLWAESTENTVQGTDGFYYQYSTKYEVRDAVEKKYQLNITPVDMTDSRDEFPFCYANPNCMSSFWETIASADYTNVIAYEAQADGQIRIDSLNVKINGDDVTGREIEFAVTDKDGVILTNSGNVTTLNASNSTVTGLTMEAKEIKDGERIYFVFHGNSGSVNSIECMAAVLFSMDGANWKRVDASGRLWAQSQDNTTQGTDGFYYQYSTAYKKLAFSAEGIDVSYNFDRYIQPYWEGTTVYNESVWVVANEDGTIDDIQLLYDIDSIEAVCSADLTQQFEEGVDYTIVDGKLHIPKKSRIPVTGYTEYYPTESGVNSFGNWGNTGYIYFDESGEIHMKQIAVTYTHSDEWKGYVPTAENGRLPKTFEKLANKEHFSIGFYGDSITTGANASGTGWINKAPYMPTWMELLIQGLKKVYKYDDITSNNYAVGGKTVQWGAENVKEKFAGANHDLVIVAFGMNNNDDASVIAEHTQKIIDGLKEINPNVEILLVSTTLANPESCAHAPNRALYENALLQLAADGVAVSCMTSVHTYLLERKEFKDMTGNNVNHPNDFLARAYAQTILTGLSQSNQEPGGPGGSGDSEEPETQEVLPGNATVPVPNAQGHYPTYKIDFEAKLMESSNVHPEFPWSMPNKEYHCMTSPKGNRIVSAGYANISTYTVQQDGTIVFKDAAITLWDKKNTVLFAITDKEGNVLYPADGTLAVLNEENNTISGILLKNYKVKAGDEINFIFEGVSGNTSAIGLMGIMELIDSTGKATRLTNENGQIYPVSGSVEQGASGFTYRYAKSFENQQTGYVEPEAPEVLPGSATVPVANEQGYYPAYKINFEAELMVSSNVHPEFPWSMPNKEYHCMTSPKGNRIVSAGYANISTYTTQQDGTIVFKDAAITLWDKKNTVLFAITDKEGNVLYPADGTLAVLNEENNTISGILLKNYKVKAGDEINFIFEGVSGNTSAIGLMGIMELTDSTGKATRLTNENGQIYPVSGSEEQGASGFTYRYAKTFENKQIGYVKPKVEVLPGNATVPQKNGEGKVPTYKIEFDATLMESSVVHPAFPWSMPDKEYDCMTNPAGERIVSAGYANISTYVVQKAGTIIFKDAYINLNTPKDTVLFAITDKAGNIIYPENGTLAVLNSETPTIVGTLLKDYKVKAGDELDFIFEGVSGKTSSISLMGILVNIDANGNETRLTHENGQFYPTNGDTSQGASGFYYRYAKNFKNIITGYVKPKDLTVNLGEAVEVKVSDNPEDLADYETTSNGQSADVDMIEILKEDVKLRHAWMPVLLIAIFAVVFGTRWMLFTKSMKQETQGGEDEKTN